MSIRWCCAVASLLVCSLVAGCGGGASHGNAISGTVSLDGANVPAGIILFSPDGAKKNKGPQGMAEIRDGKYDTRQTKRGFLGGPAIVRIEGYDGIATPDSPKGTPIFEYEVTLELPREAAVQNFDLKKDQVKPIAKSTEPPP